MQFKEVHKVVPPDVKKVMYKDAAVVEGEEVLTRQKGTLCGNVKDPQRKMGPLLTCCVRQISINQEEEWIEICILVSKNIGVKKARRRVVGLGKLAWRRPLTEAFLSASQQ